ncbi:branched-chain amino acid ABC transporter permease [Thalassococcus sp. S3]|uniref:branched-chain amino acid ABC transporter permease n=1 Tax=Thalassococcus sp. S3 TaxID=2017482 RepID=UPI00102406FC|nr:branched-chain amino acid ABC transporter permease [Thalassococcus sp. S3]QBF30825.1 branched-chain amino acid ABC transporter permease [Thalassococcus sp. S3]
MSKTFYKVGRRPWEVRGTPDGTSERNRARLPGSKRHWLAWRDVHNPKTLRRERVLIDKMPLWWTLGLLSILAIAPFLSNTMLGVLSIFCIYAAINVLWTLILGTAGIFSLATLAVVGVAGYVAAACNVYLGVPWPFMLLIGPLAGLAMGALLAAPSTRLDGLYYALLTIGVAEICRVFILQLRPLTPTGGAITNVDSFIPDDWFLQRPGLLLGFAGAFLLLLGALLVWRLVNSERLGLLLRVARGSREDEAFAEAVGIDFRRARLQVFLISSAALGVIGPFYAMYFGSISPQIFSLDTMLLLFAMMVIGGLGRAEGAVVGAAIVTFIDRGLIELGPPRIILVALCMIGVTIFAREGLTGARAQFRDYRNRKSGEARARRTEKGGEAMPEEATEVHDKQELYYRRFNKRLRERLKTLITPELIEEHKRDPLGHHSDALARVLNYFRRGEMADKYVIHRMKPAEERFRIMAVSGVRGRPPRVVDDREYTDIKDAYHAVFLLRVNDLMDS